MGDKSKNILMFKIEAKKCCRILVGPPMLLYSVDTM